MADTRLPLIVALDAAKRARLAARNRQPYHAQRLAHEQSLSNYDIAERLARELATGHDCQRKPGPCMNRATQIVGGIRLCAYHARQAQKDD